MTVALGPTRSAVIDLAHLLTEAQLREDAEPWKWVPWLPLQLRYLQSPSRYRLMRAGNQWIGKSTAALADLLASALGEHPHRNVGRREPGEYWVICASWSQSIAIQGKLHALIPPKRIHPSAVFNQDTGFRGKNPSVQVSHGGGDRLAGLLGESKYSIIRFKTTQQGALNLAGATIDGALFDEPPKSERIYTEVMQRTEASGGWISISMTPMNAPVAWIRQRVDDGLIEDIHARLTPDQMIPVGQSRPRLMKDGEGGMFSCDAIAIASKIARTPAHEVPVIVHGEWEIRVTDRYFSGFRSSGINSHVSSKLPVGDFRLMLGIDHGDRPGKQFFTLLCVQERAHGIYPSVYVLDEASDMNGTNTTEDDAAMIIAMLYRHGWTWDDLDKKHGASGDRVHLPGQARQKANLSLHRAIALLMNVPSIALMPKIRTVKRGEGRRGSLGIGSRWLFNSMQRPGGFANHPRCVRMITALDRYTMADDDWKDPIDALRYGLDVFIFSRGRLPSSGRGRMRSN